MPVPTILQGAPQFVMQWSNVTSAQQHQPAPWAFPEPRLALSFPPPTAAIRQATAVRSGRRSGFQAPRRALTLLGIEQREMAILDSQPQIPGQCRVHRLSWHHCFPLEHEERCLAPSVDSRRLANTLIPLLAPELAPAAKAPIVS